MASTSFLLLDSSLLEIGKNHHSIQRQWGRIHETNKGFKTRLCHVSLSFHHSHGPSIKVVGTRYENWHDGRLESCSPGGPMACSMFADDLLLMRKLTDQGVGFVSNIIQQFGIIISGMRLNLAKSKLAIQSEKYLRYPVVVTGIGSFDYLIHKFEARLNQWKAKFLTHAGRLVLIKSILESLPIYAMGTDLVLPKVLKKLTAIVSNFLWGGGGDKKLMACVA